MSGKISVIILIEMMLVVVTTLLLAQPKVLFKTPSESIRKVANWGGMVLLCATFCWSVIVGISLTMNGFILTI